MWGKWGGEWYATKAPGMTQPKEATVQGRYLRPFSSFLLKSYYTIFECQCIFRSFTLLPHIFYALFTTKDGRVTLLKARTEWIPSGHKEKHMKIILWLAEKLMKLVAQITSICLMSLMMCQGGGLPMQLLWSLIDACVYDVINVIFPKEKNTNLPGFFPPKTAPLMSIMWTAPGSQRVPAHTASAGPHSVMMTVPRRSILTAPANLLFMVFITTCQDINRKWIAMFINTALKQHP